MRKFIVLMVTSLIFGYGNAQRMYSVDDPNHSLHKHRKKFKFSKSNFVLQDTSMISLNSVYVSSDYLCAEKCDSSFSFIRFFKDGRVFWSFAYASPPKIEEVNDLSYGEFCFFILKGEDVIVEAFNDYSNKLFYYAKPTAFGLQFYGYGGTMNKFFLEKKQPVFFRKYSTRLYSTSK